MVARNDSDKLLQPNKPARKKEGRAETQMNVYHRNVFGFGVGPAEPEDIKVNGNPLEPGPDEDYDNYGLPISARAVVAMMRTEYGADPGRHPVSYALLFHDLVRRMRYGGDNDDYSWELTSDDLAAAVLSAQERLANRKEDDLFLATLHLQPHTCRELIRAGMVPGEFTQDRLMNWYETDQIDNDERHRRREILKLMLDHGMDPCIRADFRPWPGESLLHLMCGSCTPVEDIRLLLDRGATDVINDRGVAGNTPLHLYAARDFHHRRYPPTKDGFDLLVSYGADVNARNGRDLTPYQLLQGDNPEKYRARRRDLAEYLVDLGAEAPAEQTTNLEIK